MAILNVTPDSFYPASRIENTDHLLAAAQSALRDGAAILDIGACSTRPGSKPVDENVEWERLEPALQTIRTHLPDADLSIDTFRPAIARRALEQFGPITINDISGGCTEMYDIIRYWQVPYVWTMRGQLTPSIEQWQEMKSMQNLILDPGLGFIGGPKQDFDCLRRLDVLQQYNRPVLVGVSRKSMIYKTLAVTPEECLTPSQVLQFYALQKGAHILRTHDVRDTIHTIRLYNTLCNS